MIFYAILITIIVIFIYVTFSCRYIILSYLKYFKGQLKYKKDVYKSLKIDLKTRKLSNSTLDSGIEFLKENLNNIGYIYKGEFVIPDNIKRNLIYSKYSERAVRDLFKLITNHMGITDQGIDLNVKNVSSRILRPYVGLYDEGNKTTDKKISIFVNSDYSYETVLSIIIHESTHYYLLSNGIRLEDRDKNEYLTDIATVYLGFGKYMLEGYKQSKKIVYINELQRTTSGYKVGYINYSDVKYIIKRLKTKYKNQL